MSAMKSQCWKISYDKEAFPRFYFFILSFLNFVFNMWFMKDKDATNEKKIIIINPKQYC